MRSLLVPATLALAACGGESSPAAGDASTPACDTASGALPDGTEVISWDSGTSGGDLRSSDFRVTYEGTADAPNRESLFEAVRFDLEHPARIVGIEVMWSNVPADLDPEEALAVGLYPDFGGNGFDYLKTARIWQGS